MHEPSISVFLARSSSCITFTGSFSGLLVQVGSISCYKFTVLLLHCHTMFHCFLCFSHQDNNEILKCRFHILLIFMTSLAWYNKCYTISFPYMSVEYLTEQSFLSLPFHMTPLVLHFQLLFVSMDSLLINSRL